MQRLIALSLFLFYFSLTDSFSQIGGKGVYESLNLSPSARVTALGGNLITIRDNDLTLAFQNPSLLNEDMHNALTFNHTFHLSSLQQGYAAYGFHHQKWNTSFHLGVQYFQSGEIEAYDEFQQPLGSVKANEYVVTLGGGYQLYDRMSVGLNLKAITSRLADFNSFGLAGDIAAFYEIEESNFTATLLFKNIGTQVQPYVSGNREDLPFEIQLGISKRLKYLPFRFSIIGQQLQQWDIRYNDPDRVEEENSFFGDLEPTEESKFSQEVDNFFRHFVFNGEFLFGKTESFRIRFGYNHLRRQELSVESLRSLAGFSLGFGVKISRFQIDFGHAFYHLAGGATHFSFSTNLDEFKR
jgi:hypothetical protein